MEDVQRFWDEQVVTFDEEPITASPTGRFGWRGHGYCTGCYRRRGPTSSTLAAAREACPYFSQSSLTADQCRRLVGQHRSEATVERLDDPALWGRETHDERYAVVSRT
jgi:hypothetical protein